MKIINEKNGYKLVAPFNNWDTSYHLINSTFSEDYLIDIQDVYNVDFVVDLESGLSWESLKSLEDIENIIEWAWKVI